MGSFQVRKVLTALIQQNVVKFVKNKRGMVEYSVDIDILLWRHRIPRYIHCAKSLYGDAAELVVEDIVYHGQTLMSEAVQNVTNKLNEALENAGGLEMKWFIACDLTFLCIFTITKLRWKSYFLLPSMLCDTHTLEWKSTHFITMDTIIYALLTAHSIETKR